MLTVHGHPASTNTRTVRLLLAEKGVDHDVAIPPFGTPQHAELHPFRKMPALTGPDVALFESLAISVWVNDTLPGPDLLGADPMARARVLAWCSACVDYVYHDVVKGFVFVAMGGDAPTEAAAERARAVLQTVDGAVDRWLGADHLSLADLYLAPITAFVCSVPAAAALLEPHPGLVDHLDAVRARPSWRATDPAGA